MNEINWIPIDSEHLPPQHEGILLLYKKGKKGLYQGKKGKFITEGYLVDEAKKLSKDNPEKEDFWRINGYGLTFYDYTDRKIQSLSAKKSANIVTHWSILPDKI